MTNPPPKGAAARILAVIDAALDWEEDELSHDLENDTHIQHPLDYTKARISSIRARVVEILEG